MPLFTVQMNKDKIELMPPLQMSVEKVKLPFYSRLESFRFILENDTDMDGHRGSDPSRP